MNSTAHPVAPEEVMTLLDGELSAERAQFVSAHIEQCAECQEVQATMQVAAHKMASWKVDGPQHFLEQLILKNGRIGTSEQGGVVRLSWLQHILIRKRIWVPALAFLAVLFALVGAWTSRYDFALKHAAPSASVHTFGLEPPDRKSTDVDHAKVIRSVADEGEKVRIAGKTPFPAPPLGSPQAGTGARLLPMIARTVSLSIIVKDFDASRASLDAILARNNGYAAGLNVATPQGAARTLQASLRIPATRLVGALAELKALGRVEMETQGGEEVSQQHADLLARLKNSRETEQRLQDVLRTRTGKVKDVLEVEQEIERVRGDIEEMEAEQQILEHRVDFSTIDLKLAEEYKAQLSSPAPSVATQLRNAAVNGFRSAFESLLALVLFLAESGPAILLWLALLFLPARLLWRRYQRSLLTV